MRIPFISMSVRLKKISISVNKVYKYLIINNIQNNSKTTKYVSIKLGHKITNLEAQYTIVQKIINRKLILM